MYGLGWPAARMEKDQHEYARCMRASWARADVQMVDGDEGRNARAGSSDGGSPHGTGRWTSEVRTLALFCVTAPFEALQRMIRVQTQEFQNVFCPRRLFQDLDRVRSILHLTAWSSDSVLPHPLTRTQTRIPAFVMAWSPVVDGRNRSDYRP